VVSGLFKLFFIPYWLNGQFGFYTLLFYGLAFAQAVRTMKVTIPAIFAFLKNVNSKEKTQK
jgi:uncharacterized membrane protein YccC